MSKTQSTYEEEYFKSLAAYREKKHHLSMMAKETASKLRQKLGRLIKQGFQS